MRYKDLPRNNLSEIFLFLLLGIEPFMPMIEHGVYFLQKPYKVQIFFPLSLLVGPET